MGRKQDPVDCNLLTSHQAHSQWIKIDYSLLYVVFANPFIYVLSFFLDFVVVVFRIEAPLYCIFPHPHLRSDRVAEGKKLHKERETRADANSLNRSSLWPPWSSTTSNFAQGDCGGESSPSQTKLWVRHKFAVFFVAIGSLSNFYLTIPCPLITPSLQPL